MAAAGLLVLGGGGAGAYFFLFAKKPHDEKPVVGREGAADFRRSARRDGEPAKPGQRAARATSRPRSCSRSRTQKLAEQVKPLLPRVMDAFQTYLREMRSSDLEGSAGLYRLRDELTRRVNLAVAPTKINAVLFKEIVVQ